MKNNVLNDMDLVWNVLDGLMQPRRAERATGWATSSVPTYEPQEFTTTKVYHYPPKDCQCGDTCTCVGKRRPNVKFEDVLDDVVQVIFNEPATIVTFSDGSKVCVKACSKDTFNKEVGLVYALVKRLYANDNDENGYLRSRGLGEKMEKLLAKAIDQKDKERERRRKQKQAKKEKAQAEKDNLINEVSEQAAKEAVDQIYNEPTKK